MAAYVRVSTADQNSDAQLQELRNYAARRGVGLLEYVDHGISGRKDRRPALNAMMAACRAREVSGVVVARLDRLARSVLHLAELGDELGAKVGDLLGNEDGAVGLFVVGAIVGLVDGRGVGAPQNFSPAVGLSVYAAQPSVPRAPLRFASPRSSPAPRSRDAQRWRRGS